MSGTADGPATRRAFAPARRPPAILRPVAVPGGQLVGDGRHRPRVRGRDPVGALLSQRLFSAGGSLLIWLVGIPIIALGLELAGLFARLERWRMTLVDPRPLVPHPYRPLNGMPQAPYGAWLRTWAEAEFLDASRWRDIVYFLILRPARAPRVRRGHRPLALAFG